MAAGAKISNVQLDLSELEELQKKSTRKYVNDVLSLEIRKLQSHLTQLQDEAVNKPSPDSTSTNESKRYQIKLNGYGWDQSDKFVKVFVTLKNVQTLPQENVFCTITENSMELFVKDLDNKDYTLVINKLLKPIVPSNCHWKQKTDMVVIFLAKSEVAVKWSHMTEIEKQFEENKSSKFKTDNTDSKNPQDSLMGLMRNLYESGDDDMKRTITQAWVEGQEKRNTNLMDT